MEFINEKLEKFNSNTKNKKIAIIGLGISNTPLIEYFKNNGSYVTVFDERTKEEMGEEIINKLEKENVIYYLGKNCLDHLVGYDYIFRSPSIRPDKEEIVKEVERGAILTSEIEKVIELTPSTVIGVTGSDGKTTTTTLIYEILKKKRI